MSVRMMTLTLQMNQKRRKLKKTLKQEVKRRRRRRGRRKRRRKRRMVIKGKEMPKCYKATSKKMIKA